MQLIQKYERFTFRIAELFNIIGLSIIFAILMVTASDIVLRYLRFPIRGAYEIVEMGLGIGVMFSMANATVTKGHIAFDDLIKRFSARTRAIIDVMITLSLIFVWVIIGWQGTLFAIRTSRAASDILKINLSLVKLSIPLASLFVIMVLIGFLLRDVRKLLTMPEPGKEE